MQFDEQVEEATAVQLCDAVIDFLGRGLPKTQETLFLVIQAQEEDTSLKTSQPLQQHSSPGDKRLRYPCEDLQLIRAFLAMYHACLTIIHKCSSFSPALKQSAIQMGVYAVLSDSPYSSTPYPPSENWPISLRQLWDYTFGKGAR